MGEGLGRRSISSEQEDITSGMSDHIMATCKETGDSMAIGIKDQHLVILFDTPTDAIKFTRETALLLAGIIERFVMQDIEKN